MTGPYLQNRSRSSPRRGKCEQKQKHCSPVLRFSLPSMPPDQRLPQWCSLSSSSPFGVAVTAEVQSRSFGRLLSTIPTPRELLKLWIDSKNLHLSPQCTCHDQFQENKQDTSSDPIQKALPAEHLEQKQIKSQLSLLSPYVHTILPLLLSTPNIALISKHLG
jgi:hypothetical protein